MLGNLSKCNIIFHNGSFMNMIDYKGCKWLFLNWFLDTTIQTTLRNCGHNVSYNPELHIGYSATVGKMLVKTLIRI